MSCSYLIQLTYNYLKAIISEMGALCILILTFPLDLTRRDIPTDQTNTPILLVHGYLHSSAAWIYLRNKLLKKNLGPVYTINLGSPFQSIEDYAERLRAKTAFIAKQTGRKDLILVGHSMGGLVCSYYAAYLAPKNTIKTVITIGSPLKGTRMAIFGFGRCAGQMRYKSSFTTCLNQRMSESKSIPFYHLGSATDLIIRPPASAWLKGQNTHCETFEDLGHIALLYSPRIANKIIQYLHLIDSFNTEDFQPLTKGSGNGFTKQ